MSKSKGLNLVEVIQGDGSMIVGRKRYIKCFNCKLWFQVKDAQYERKGKVNCNPCFELDDSELNYQVNKKGLEP